MSLSLGFAHYRRLLRSVKFAFAQDVKAVRMANLQLHEEFMKHRFVNDGTTLATLYKNAEEVDEMLRFYIVQAKKTAKGSFGKPVYR